MTTIAWLSIIISFAYGYLCGKREFSRDRRRFHFEQRKLRRAKRAHDLIVEERKAQQLPPPERPEALVASTGCVLTDQIFEAAWKAGICPYDEIGPPCVYEDDS